MLNKKEKFLVKEYAKKLVSKRKLVEADTIIYKTVADFIPMVKPNSKTYYNLDTSQIAMLRKLYSNLIKNKDKQVGLLGATRAAKVLESDEVDYLKKYKAMDIILQNIKH